MVQKYQHVSAVITQGHGGTPPWPCVIACPACAAYLITVTGLRIQAS